MLGVATVPWSAVWFHEEAGGGGGHLLTDLIVSASFCKCVGISIALMCLCMLGGLLKSEDGPVWDLTSGKVSP